MANIYLAGGLFNAGERLHNLFLAKHLEALGHKVILPQVTALKFFKGGCYDLTSIGEDCRQSAIDVKNIYVGNADGPDADSGTCVEYGLALGSTGRAVVYRTDFRTAEGSEVGINIMLKLKGSIIVYFPCYFTNLNQVDGYYKELAQKIHEAILTIAK